MKLNLSVLASHRAGSFHIDNISAAQFIELTETNFGFASLQWNCIGLVVGLFFSAMIWPEVGLLTVRHRIWKAGFHLRSWATSMAGKNISNDNKSELESEIQSLAHKPIYESHPRSTSSLKQEVHLACLWAGLRYDSGSSREEEIISSYEDALQILRSIWLSCWRLSSIDAKWTKREDKQWNDILVSLTLAFTRYSAKAIEEYKFSTQKIRPQLPPLKLETDRFQEIIVLNSISAELIRWRHVRDRTFQFGERRYDPIEI